MWINERVAKYVVEVPGVFGLFDTPIILVSRRVSPYYISCEKLASHPEAYDTVCKGFEERIRAYDRKPEKLITTEVRGLFFAPPVAMRLRTGVVCVRKKPKGYGVAGNIMGELNEGDYLIGLDDLATTASSSLKAVKVARDAGARIDRYLFVFDRNEGSTEALREVGVQLDSLVRMGEEFLTVVKPEQAKVLEPYVPDPLAWSRRYVQEHPDYVRDRLAAVVKERKVTETAPVEIFTKAHPELREEFELKLNEWLRELTDEDPEEVWKRAESA